MRASLSALALAASALLPTGAVAAPCTPTGYAGLTAAVINPATTVSGTVDATGCDIGIYIDAGEGAVDGAHVFGATRFGVMVNGDSSFVAMDVTNTRVSNIGDSPLSGNQHGVGIYYRGFFAAGSASGRIVGNTVEAYQKGGITANGIGVSVQIRDNVVTGDGPTTRIAQNGIQIGYGATATVMKNTVTGNSYTGGYWASGGILVVGGAGYGTCPDGGACPYTTGTRITQNTVDGNDVGVFLSNYAAGFTAPESATNIHVVNNKISNTVLLNPDYQAGISDVGNNDKMIANTITGYTTGVGNYTVKIDADASFTNRPKVHATK